MGTDKAALLDDISTGGAGETTALLRYPEAASEPGTGPASRASSRVPHSRRGSAVDGDPAYVIYTRRWYLLGIFVLLSFEQCLIWLTFSPIAQAAEGFYHVKSATIDLMLNWGPIIYCIVVFAVVPYSRRPGSTRGLVLIGGFLCAGGTALRLVPVWAPGIPHTWKILLTHACQVMNAAVGPIVMSLPPKLSSTWFAENERTTATAVGILANNLGAAAGFFAPLLVHNAEEIPRILYAHFALATFAFLLMLVYFPDKPPKPPSPAAELMVAASLKPLSWSSLLAEARLALSSKSFLIIAVFGGGLGGLYNGWTGSLDLILPQPPYSPSSAGYLGLGTTAACLVGELAVGPIADRVPLFHKRLKLLLIICLGASVLCSTWLMLALPFFGWSPFLPSAIWSTGTAVSLLGLFLGAINPLWYELGVELTFPAQELVSSGFISLANNVWCLVFLFVLPHVNTRSLNFMVTVGIVIACALTFLINEQYKRVDTEGEVHDKHRGSFAASAGTLSPDSGTPTRPRPPQESYDYASLP